MIRSERLEGELPQAPTRVLNTSHAARGCCGWVFLVTEDRADRFVADTELNGQLVQSPLAGLSLDRCLPLSRELATAWRLVGIPLWAPNPVSSWGHGKYEGVKREDSPARPIPGRPPVRPPLLEGSRHVGND